MGISRMLRQPAVYARSMTSVTSASTLWNCSSVSAPENGAIDELFTTTLSYPDGEGGVISDDNYATDNFPDGGLDSSPDDGDAPVEDIFEE